MVRANAQKIRLSLSLSESIGLGRDYYHKDFFTVARSLWIRSSNPDVASF